jgi:hypothetical protein
MIRKLRGGNHSAKRSFKTRHLVYFLYLFIVIPMQNSAVAPRYAVSIDQNVLSAVENAVSISGECLKNQVNH